jgi:hypothetical protein
MCSQVFSYPLTYSISGPYVKFGRIDHKYYFRPIKEHHFTKFHNIDLDHPLTNKLVIFIFVQLIGNYAKKLFQDRDKKYS